MTRWNLMIEVETLAELKEFARREHVSASSVMRYAIRKYLKDRRQPPSQPHGALPTPVDTQPVNHA